MKLNINWKKIDAAIDGAINYIDTFGNETETKLFGEPLDNKIDRLYDKTGQLIATGCARTKEWYATRKGN